ncbi:MAG: hypothetical protein LUE16_01755 [Lachnospiraceae bacterium]|nr:hypothetical protein [Lachnospiraceae bacterium]
MYKKQLTAQKIICLAAVIVSAVVFVYSLGLVTDLYDTLYSTMRNANDLTSTDVSGSIVYYNIQDFNRQFMYASIGLLLLSVLLMITNTHTRRKYYIGNYVAVGLYSVAGLVLMVWAHIQIEVYKAQFLEVDFEALKEHAEMWGTAYTESTFFFDIHYLVFGLLLVVVVLLVGNVFWKRSLMKEEQELLAKGKEATA